MTDLTTHFQTSKPTRPDELNLRLHRALSWLGKAEASKDDLDIQFIALWIAFNAVYAREFVSTRSADKMSFTQFLNHICRLDKTQQLYNLIWQRFSQNIRVMLNNPYVFQPFWDYHNGKISENAWQQDFAKANQKAQKALVAQDTHAILMVVFDRLYTLRNQLVHGGATYQSHVNRDQLKDGCHILFAIVPIIIQIILDNPQQPWGKPFYPVVN